MTVQVPEAGGRTDNSKGGAGNVTKGSAVATDGTVSTPQGGAEKIAVPTATPSRTGFVAEFPGRMPSRTTMGWKGCLAHFAYRQQNQIQLVLLGHLRPKLVCELRAIFPNVARAIAFVGRRCRHIMRLQLASRHRRMVRKTRSQSVVVTP
jgi:hypothetical protein